MRALTWTYVLLLAAAGVCSAQEQPPSAARPAAAAPAQSAPVQSPAAASPQPAPQKPAEIKIVTPPDAIDGAFSVDLFYWYSPNHPFMRTGRSAAHGLNYNLDLPNNKKSTPGIRINLPVGGQNNLRLSYFRSKGQGNTVAPADVSYFGTDYAQGDYLSSGYTVQNVKISLDYLSWPFPVRTANFRIKTLWELQYTNIKTTFDAPLKTDTQSFATASNWFVYPSLGMGIEERFSKNVRFEVRGSGFAIPHLPTLWDAEGFLAVRAGQIEFQFGGKAFHFKTSPRQDHYLRDTLSGAFVGVRWYPK